MAQGIRPWTICAARCIGGNAVWIPERTGTTLLAKPKPSDRRAIPLDVLARQIRQQTTPLSHQLEQSAPGVEVVLVLAEVIGQPVDPLGEESDLNLRRTGIIRVGAKLRNDRLFLLGQERHTSGILSENRRLQKHKTALVRALNRRSIALEAVSDDESRCADHVLQIRRL